MRRRNLKIAEFSQEYRLADRLEQVGISHGFEGRVVVPMVRVSSGVMFFCDARPVHVLQQDIAGDGGEIPETVHLLKPIRSAADGYYDLEAHLVVNGALSLKIRNLTPRQRLLA